MIKKPNNLYYFWTDENGEVTKMKHKDVVIIPSLEHLDVILPNSDTDDFKCALKTCEIRNTDTPVWQQYQEWFDSFIKEEYENNSTRLTPEENKSFLSLLTLWRDENVSKLKPSEGE